MNDDNKNLFLAIALSIVVVIGWNWFYAAPQAEKAREVAASSQNAPAAVAPSVSTAGAVLSGSQTSPGPSAAAGGGASLTRQQALAQNPRVAIKTKSLIGSISLRGGVIDDVSLADYRETTDPSSQHIILFSPSGAPGAYYAQSGFVSASQNPGLPDSSTLWNSDATELTAAKPITLTWDNGHGLLFKRTISVDDRYMFAITDSVENKTSAPITISPYALIARHGRPQTSGYAVIFEGFLGYVGDKGLQQLTYDKVEKAPDASIALTGKGGWLGFTDKYWATSIIPAQTQDYAARFYQYGGADKVYETDDLGGAQTIAPGASAASTFHLFTGAKEVQTIDGYETSLGIEKFNLMIDWGWFWFITQPLFQLLDFIYRYVGNFGLAIMIVTVMVKAAFFPLANRSYLSMAKMKSIQPLVQALKEKYPDDKNKQQMEMMEIYKREKINPVAGCWPMLLQIPVFFALYKVIFTTIEMRQAPFFGWIHDLSSPDPTNVFTLFGLIPWTPTAMPLFGHFLAIGIWPMIMGLSMFFQMKMNPEPPDPVQKQMFAWMPVIFTFMLGSFPAGLVIYWTWNNSLSVIQQYLIMRRAGVKVELWDNLRNLIKKKSGAVA